MGSLLGLGGISMGGGIPVNNGSGAIASAASSSAGTGHVTNVPSDVSSATLFAWYDFSTQAGAGGSSISSVSDLSGNSYTATQSTGINKPTVTAAWSNGLKAGTATAAQWLDTGALIVSPPSISPCAWFCTGQFTSGAATLGMWDISTPGDTQCFVSATNVLNVTNGATGGDGTFTSAAIVSPCQLDGQFGADAKTVTAWINGTERINIASSATSGNSITRITLCSQDAHTIGGSTIGEWFCFTGIISALEALAMRSYLKTKWGTP